MHAKILLVDDSAPVRAAIRRLLSERPEWNICAEAGDGEEAVEKARLECPDLAILDIEMPRKNGIQAAREILKFCPQTIVISDSIHDAAILLAQLKAVGVRGFVPKDRLASDLIPTIRAVLEGGTLFRVPAGQAAELS
jgi:DNA-binding NarL/FixJ family response regulator